MESKSVPALPPTTTKRRRWRLSLRALMVVVLVVGGGLGWQARRASIQRRAVAAIKASGGTVLYDYQAAGGPPYQVAASPSAPRWLRNVVGDELFQEVAVVFLANPETGPPTVTPSTWAAVLACDHLEALTTQRMPLDDAALVDLATLTRLKSVSLHEITIGGTGLEQMARLANLTNLQLESTLSRLPGSSLRALAGLNRLETLAIAGLDPITAADLAPLHKLRRLQRLRLEPSPADARGVESLLGLDQLQTVDFRQTALTDAACATLADLPKLEAVLFDGSQVTDVGLAHLARPSLKWLSLYSSRGTCQITDAGLAHLAGCNRLIGMWLNVAGLSGQGFAALGKLPIRYLFLEGLTADHRELVRAATGYSLGSFGLSGAAVDDDWLALLTNQAKLKLLDLNQTGVTDAGMSQVVTLCPALQFLVVDATGLTDTGLLKLAAIPTLNTISARGTKVTAAGIAALRALRPGVTVETGPVTPPPRHGSNIAL